MMPRTRRSWTKEEDECLRKAVGEAVESKRPLLWRELAKSVPGRTNKDCRRRWWNCLAGVTARGPWLEEEDARLTEAVQKYGNQWNLVACMVGSRNADQCSSHWSQVLDPNINHADWTTQEDDRLLHAVLSHGTNWTQVAQTHVPRRTTLALKNRFFALRHRNKTDTTANEGIADSASHAYQSHLEPADIRCLSPQARPRATLQSRIDKIPDPTIDRYEDEEENTSDGSEDEDVGFDSSLYGDVTPNYVVNTMPDEFSMDLAWLESHPRSTLDYTTPIPSIAAIGHHESNTSHLHNYTTVTPKAPNSAGPNHPQAQDPLEEWTHLPISRHLATGFASTPPSAERRRQSANKSPSNVVVEHTGNHRRHNTQHECSLPTPPQAYRPATPTRHSTELEKVARDRNATPTESESPQTSGVFSLSLSMVCTIEQLRDIMTRLADAGPSISMKIDPK